MTTDATKELVSKLMRDSEPRLSQLYYRWQDERAYEDFRDYVAEMRKIVDAFGGGKFEFVSGHKGTFGYRVIHDGRTYHIYLTAQNIGWKLVAPCHPRRARHY